MLQCFACPDVVSPETNPSGLRFIAARVGAFRTNALNQSFVDPPVAPAPFVRRAEGGEITRAVGANATRSDTIIGERLTGATQVVFSQPGTTAEVVGVNAEGTRLDVVITAQPNAVLTGDAVTTFTVTTAGGTSNAAGYVILPAAP